MDISLITSLYRSEAYLDTFTRNAQVVSAAVRAAGLSLEIVLVANDPTERERNGIRRLEDTLKTAETAQVVVLEVPRETVYASWNRGIASSQGHCIGPWNVDDRRTAAALVEGTALFASGCSLVYFPYTVVRHFLVAGAFTLKRNLRYKARPFDKTLFSRAMRGASFWMCTRELYEHVGPFDKHFRICGDFEWVARAVEVTDFCPGTQHGGEFHLHGGNLSDTGNPLQVVESNIVRMRRGAWDQVEPAEPELMKKCWDEWGSQGVKVPKGIEDQLWGEDAFDRWQAWLHEQRAKCRRIWLSEALRLVPRFIINCTGMRPYLARVGIVKSSSFNR